MYYKMGSHHLGGWKAFVVWGSSKVPLWKKDLVAWYKCCLELLKGGWGRAFHSNFIFLQKLEKCVSWLKTNNPISFYFILFYFSFEINGMQCYIYSTMFISFSLYKTLNRLVVSWLKLPKKGEAEKIKSGTPIFTGLVCFISFSRIQHKKLVSWPIPQKTKTQILFAFKIFFPPLFPLFWESKGTPSQYHHQTLGILKIQMA